MNILIVVQNYLPFVGGVEVHARQVAHAFAREGHRVEIVASTFAPYSGPGRLAVLQTSLFVPPHDDFLDDGIPVHALTPSALDRLSMLPAAVRALPIIRRYAYSGLNTFGYRWYRRVYLTRLRRLVRGRDVVHSLAGGYLGWCVREAAELEGVPFACTPFCHPHQWGDAPEDVRYYLGADAVIGLVDTDTAYLAELGVPPAKLNTIGVSPDLCEGADPGRFRSAQGWDAAPVVLYVGRMMPQKGANALLNAVELVWKERPDVRFAFIGPASQSEALIFENLDKRVRYLGKVDARTKADALAACDVFCMPSISEILPTVYLEAWTLGKPVIGGLAHGLTELIVGNQAGMTVPQDPAEIGRAIVRLLGDESLRTDMGRAGQRLVEREYSVEAVTHKLLSLYGQLAASKSCGARS